MVTRTRFPLTSRAKSSLMIARDMATTHGHVELSGVHAALGILREGNNPAVAVLEVLGVDLEKLERDLEAALPPRGHGAPATHTTSNMPGEAEVLAAAEEQSDLHGTRYVATEHLLLGLIQDANAPAGRVFLAHGVTRDSAFAAVQRLLSGTTTPPLGIGSIVMRCYEFDRMLAFWTAALGYVADRPSDGGFVILKDPAGTGPNVSLDRSPTRREGRRGWIHLDLYAVDQAAEVQRLEELGAVRYPWRYEAGADYVVLADPEDNLFCVVQR